MGYDVGLLILTPNGWMWLSDLGTCGFKHLEHLFGSQLPRMSQNFYPQRDHAKILQVPIHLELLNALSYSEFYEKYYGISAEEYQEPHPNDLVLMVITEEYWDCHPPLSEMITIQSTP